MIRLAFNRGEEENAFVAAGAHSDRSMAKDYKIVVKRSPPLEDGRIPMEFKISYATTWADIELTGAFDPKENSLRGTMLIPFYGTTGEFVFKRDPDLVKFYPAPSITGARERWEFATKSVLDRIRRKIPLRKRLQRGRTGRTIRSLSRALRSRRAILRLLGSHQTE